VESSKGLHLGKLYPNWQILYSGANTNAVAYYDLELITAVKIMVQTLGERKYYCLKLFFISSFEEEGKIVMIFFSQILEWFLQTSYFYSHIFTKLLKMIISFYILYQLYKLLPINYCLKYFYITLR
jgi:hypothetical protein